jgi:hypothetical protein
MKRRKAAVMDFLIVLLFYFAGVIPIKMDFLIISPDF